MCTEKRTGLRTEPSGILTFGDLVVGDEPARRTEKNSHEVRGESGNPSVWEAQRGRRYFKKEAVAKCIKCYWVIR